jgi:hypothetical protein
MLKNLGLLLLSNGMHLLLQLLCLGTNVVKSCKIMAAIKALFSLVIYCHNGSSIPIMKTKVTTVDQSTKKTSKKKRFQLEF